MLTASHYTLEWPSSHGWLKSLVYSTSICTVNQLTNLVSCSLLK